MRIDLVEQFGAADAVVVTDRLNRTLARCDAPDRLAMLMEVLTELSDDWSVPATGVPIADVRFVFRRDDVAIGNLGIDTTFLAAHAHGSFFARDCDEATAERLFAAIRARRVFRSVLLDGLE